MLDHLLKDIDLCRRGCCSRWRDTGRPRMIKKESNRETLSSESFLRICTHNCSAHLSDRRFNDVVHCICLVRLKTDQIMPWINQEKIARACCTEMSPGQSFILSLLSLLIGFLSCLFLHPSEYLSYCHRTVILNIHICMKYAFIFRLKLFFFCYQLSFCSSTFNFL